MKKYNVVLEENYTTHTENFGLIEVEQEVEEKEVLVINNRNYVIFEKVEDEDVENELLILKEHRLIENVHVLTPLYVQSKDVKAMVLGFLQSSENDITLKEKEAASSEVEEILHELGFEFCDEESVDGVHYSTYEAEEYGVLTIRKRLGSDKYEIEKE